MVIRRHQGCWYQRDEFRLFSLSWGKVRRKRGYKSEDVCFHQKQPARVFFAWSVQLGNRPGGFFISSSLGIRQIIVTRKVWSIMSSPQPPQTNPGKTDGKMELCSTSACFFPKYLKVSFWKVIQNASFVLLSFCTAFLYSIIELLYWFTQFNCVAIHIFIISFSNHKWLNTAASQAQ